nr:ribonuclease H-like domain-containing protein [Tanacetum cinerariifolium]
PKVNIARPKAVLNAVKGNYVSVVKASTYWVWRPKHKVLDYVSETMVHQCPLKELTILMRKDDPSKIRTGKLHFEDVYFVKELKFSLFSVSQMCDKKNSVLFTDTACVVLTPGFKLTDKSHVLLKVPRKDIMYSVDLKNLVPQGGLTCLFAKPTSDESIIWHRRLGHVNFKNINKLVKGNLVRGLPSKLFEINETCVACQKGKQHRSSCIENLIDLRVKVIRCDNGSEFKNRVMNQFCEMKGIKRQFSVSRTPQQNRVAKMKNRTLIKTHDPPFSSNSKDSPGVGFKPSGEEEKKDAKDVGNKDSDVPTDNAVDENIVYGCVDDPNIPDLKKLTDLDMSKMMIQWLVNNLDTYFQVSLVLTTRIHKDHPLNQVIRDLQSTTQTRQMTKNLEEYGFVKLPNGKKAIGTKWVFRNKKDEKGIVIKNIARLVAQGYTQEERIDYDEVFAPVSRIEVVRLFLAYALFKDFVLYQMDVKSAFLYGKIKEEVYVCQPPGFEDPDFLDKVYKKSYVYLFKKIDGWKPRALKNKSFTEIQELFNKAMKMINNFVSFRTELVEKSTKKDMAEIAQESNSKRAGDELNQERSKKQKIEDDNESAELKRCLEIVLDNGDDVTIDATPLSSKSPTIMDYKIYKEGRKSYF